MSVIFIAISKCAVRNKCKRVYTDVFKMCFSMKVQLQKHDCTSI